MPLAPLTTLRVGPVARRVITCASTEQVVATLGALDAEPAPAALVLAGGSNVVIADDLTDLTVVRLANNGITVDGNVLRAEAGAVWDDVVVARGGARIWAGWSACPVSPGRPARPRCRTSAPTASRSPTPSRRVRLLDRRTGDGALDAGRATSASATAPACSRHSDAAVVLEVEFALDPAGRSAPLRYGELAAALDADDGDRADPARGPRRGAGAAGGKGMVLDAADHDTWSVGLVLHQPGCAARDFYAALAGRGRTVRCRTIPPPTG